jgi:hypothetical protein|tara:strand:+ start:383 stop:649 length:267 start_codon:yes stop_codon:yes gene_type:complete
MKWIVLVAKMLLLAVIASLFLPQGATWFTEIMNNNSQSMGIFVLLCLVILAIEQEDVLKAGTKGITDEYESKSGETRTAKKLREEHIV